MHDVDTRDHVRLIRAVMLGGQHTARCLCCSLLKAEAMDPAARFMGGGICGVRGWSESCSESTCGMGMGIHRQHGDEKRDRELDPEVVRYHTILYGMTT
ncbi:hypothetical protein K491DRAFT_227808 [Lophiostoma macrostomum CBS 122681]|uniref:Uncharacterized protein n=1 Tax=Lophiostoma macrostomum CBS 122681 TaxID=1314788 RepID=A0A6A6SMZ8_9PLEO|nr:hypothetical protein K491DRAFT_227808 [Lophiostoma macrostomum CBS 122681]